MRQFSVKTFDASGQLKSEITGTQAHHYPDTDTLEIDRVLIRAINEVGELTTASALQAISNSDASEVRLIGQALVERQPSRDTSGRGPAGLNLQGRVFARLHGNRARHIEQTCRTHPCQDRFTANSMDYDTRIASCC